MKIIDIANQYNKTHGLAPVEEPEHICGERKARDIAEFYMCAQSLPNDPAVRKAYKALNAEVAEQFHILEQHGYRMFATVIGTTYHSAGAMASEVRQNYRLFVWNGGTPEHGLMSQEQNMRFRFVHDIFGHVMHGLNFGHFGEELAYGAHVQMFSPLAQQALATETRGQNCAYHFGTPEESFKTQKAIILPQYMREF
jgi:hypothetical protein